MRIRNRIFENINFGVCVRVSEHNTCARIVSNCVVVASNKTATNTYASHAYTVDITPISLRLSIRRMWKYSFFSMRTSNTITWLTDYYCTASILYPRSNSLSYTHPVLFTFVRIHKKSFLRRSHNFTHMRLVYTQRESQQNCTNFFSTHACSICNAYFFQFNIFYTRVFAEKSCIYAHANDPHLCEFRFSQSSSQRIIPILTMMRGWPNICGLWLPPGKRCHHHQHSSLHEFKLIKNRVSFFKGLVFFSMLEGAS